MICVRAPKLETRLKALTKLTGETKSFVVRTALEIFLRQQENLNELQKKATELSIKEIQKKKEDLFEKFQKIEI